MKQVEGCNSQKLLFDGITGFTGFQKIKLILLSCQKQGCLILDQLFGIAPMKQYEPFKLILIVCTNHFHKRVDCHEKR